jgi:methionyl-tRNA formyltransferase
MENNELIFMKIIFLGTPEFGAIILEGLVKNKFKPVLVIAGQDKPTGRKQTITPPPVKVTADKFSIPILQPQKIKDINSKIKNLCPDLIICAAYGHIVPKEILDIPKYGCLNIHPSLLPKYRGASPIQTAILNGDNKTGLTVILMNEKMDQGPIVAQKELKSPISNKSCEELSKNLAELGAELLIKTIPLWINGEIEPKTQDDSKATYTKILKKEDGRIEWKKPAKKIERQIRAFSSWPGSFCCWETTDNKRKLIKILEADIYSCFGDKKIGEVFLTEDKKLAVQAGQNCLIVKELQPEGKNQMSSEEFLRGYRDIIGTILK